METPQANNPESEKSSTIALNWFPGMSTEILERAATKVHTLILMGTAAGGFNKEFITVLKTIVDAGTPVFVLTDNLGSGHGVVVINDQPQVDAIEAGVTYLERPNISDLNDLVANIENALDQGLKGKDLAQSIENHFRFPEGQRPTPDMGTKEAFDRYQKRVWDELGF